MPERPPGGSTLSPEELVRARAWAEADPDPATRREVEELLAAGDAEGIRERFDGRLQFGTAGLRGLLGAGPQRMNRLLVRQAAAGLAAHLGEGARVVIGRDARRGSESFAEDSARVFAAAGLEALVLPDTVPTPLLSFAVRRVGADAGVMVTASHNPPAYNGYKVYLGDGAQIIPPADRQIAAAIDAVADPLHVPLAEASDPRIRRLDDGVVDAYVQFAASRVAPGGHRDVSVVYTPMHGVAGRIALEAFERAGFPTPRVVAAQFDPDPDFPTVRFPNPEEPGALDLALAEAEATGADLVLANDPDGDRLGAAVREEGSWRPLTGNEIGALLAHHVLERTEGDDRLVVTTIVSSQLLSAVAAAEGVHYAETLTGFKWVVRPGLEDPSLRFVFGYEEALGYSVAEEVRDKDGITAALVLAELVASERAAGGTPIDRLTDLADRFGFHGSLQWSLREEGPGGHDRIAAAMERLRLDPPSQIGGSPVTAMTDYLAGEQLPPSDAVRLEIPGTRIVVRPSGTEPKLKCYFDTVVPLEARPSPYAATREVAGRELERVRAATAVALGLGEPG